MKELNICSICNTEDCKEKPCKEENLNKVIYAELTILKHSVSRIGCNIKSDDRDIIKVMSDITAGIEKLETLLRGSNEVGNSIEKKGSGKVACSNCNKAVELTEKNCHSVFSHETEQIESYFFCKFCQKMISYKKI